MWLLTLWIALPGEGLSSQVIDHYPTQQACVDAGKNTVVKASIRSRGYTHNNNSDYSIVAACTQLGED